MIGSSTMNMARNDTTVRSRRMRHRRSMRTATRHHRRHLVSCGAASSERIPVTKSSGGEVVQPDTATNADRAEAQRLQHGLEHCRSLRVGFHPGARSGCVRCRLQPRDGRSDLRVGTEVGVFSGNADLELRAPFSSMLSLLNHFYGVGGIGVSRIVGYGKSGTTTTSTSGQTNGYGGAYATGTQFSNSFGNAKTGFGWNAGAGVSFGWGRSALFLESRYFSVNTSNSFGAKTHFVPIILGLTFR